MAPSKYFKVLDLKSFLKLKSSLQWLTKKSSVFNDNVIISKQPFWNFLKGDIFSNFISQLHWLFTIKNQQELYDTDNSVFTLLTTWYFY